MISVNYLTLLLIGLLGHGNKCVRVDIENEFLLLILLFDNMYTAVSIAFKLGIIQTYNEETHANFLSHN